jgi:Rod binding domain-containing protein
MDTESVSACRPPPGIPSPDRDAKAKGPVPDHLRRTCGEFEAVVVGMLLKEGLKPKLEDGIVSSPGNEQLHEFAIEQVAREIGRNGSFGIADMLFEELSAR